MRGEPRVLKIATTTYVTTILIENPNVDGVVRRAPYTLKIYSSSSKDPIRIIEGATFIGRNSTFALFEGPFELVTSPPFRAVFEWGKNLIWEKSQDEIPLIAVENINLIVTESGRPRLEARLSNKTQKEIKNVEVVTLLSDVAGNIMAASKTFVDTISPQGGESITFNWPSPFLIEPISIRILPHPLPDKSFVR